MPELPEVETVKNGVQKALGLALIKKVKIYNSKFRIPVPEDIEQKLSLRQIVKYHRIGKYFIINLDNNLSIIWHLGMSGKIKIFKSLPESLQKHDHIVIETSNGCLVFNDARRFGIFTYSNTSNLYEHNFFAKMGVEPFSDKFDAKYLFEQLKNKTNPIKVSLLDQKIVNGIGNIYASEILYDARISPLRISKNVSLKECESIVISTKKILQKAIDNGGSTLKDYQKPDGSLGYFQNMHAVYGKEGQKCPNCACDICKNSAIKKIVQAGRSSFYCPTLQK